ncbi:MAG TPA: response regulator [Thermoanaerobaculia bacterium]|jgi:DNA-binding response OmpR family regulator|nr:response regulator [Thermoanaerobaculia bacterium]
MPDCTDVLRAKILIVDDQESNLRLLGYVFRRGGYVAVASTANPLQVRALHLENRYDLIILDLQMPLMNGFEVMESLQSVEAGPRVPILILSADPAEMVRALEAGASSFLSKPFVLDELLRHVHLMLVKALAVNEPMVLAAVPRPRTTHSPVSHRRTAA